MVYVPTDMPEPNQDTYQGKVEEAILQFSWRRGRIAGLFTSYAQLKEDRRGPALPIWKTPGSRCSCRAKVDPANNCWPRSARPKSSVMFGTRSFWEGVDVQGEALSALVICRLPFAVPTDPIVAARSETFNSPFFEYQVPEAILHTRQGFRPPDPLHQRPWRVCPP